MSEIYAIGKRHVLDALIDVVGRATYKAGWTFTVEWRARDTEHLADTCGWTLSIKASVVDSSVEVPADADLAIDELEHVDVDHWFNVPAVSWDGETWERWLLDRILEVERHEAMEFYCVDGAAPFFPAHGPGKDPYEIRRIVPTVDVPPQSDRSL